MTRAIITRSEGDNIITAGGPYVITAQGIELISTLSFAAQQAADAAAQSEANAASSAGAAAGSASAASGSATSAASSATAAGNAKTAAETAANNAATSATAAGGSATSASGSASAAAGSASSASDSAFTASTAKDVAETAAANAATSAGAASGSATAADNSAGAASGSATAAAGSASSASGSATAAGTAKGAAETALNSLRNELPNFSYAVTTLEPGANATLAGGGTYPDITLSFGVPRGEPAQDPNFTASANTGAAGSSAAVTVTGTYPDLAFEFTIPRGADGTGAVSSVSASAPTGLDVAVATPTTTPNISITYQAGYQGYTTVEAGKLAGVAIDATKNLTDGYLLNRTNHTGRQGIDTVQNLQSTLDGKASTAVATTAVNGLMAAADKGRLDNIADNANNYTHPATDGSRHVPATAAANTNKFLKSAAAAGGTPTWGAPTKADVGLGNVDNTSDANKPVSTPQQTALNAKLPNNGGTFTGGYSGPAPSALTGASVTPSPVDGNVRTRSNTGAWTLNAPTVAGSYTIAIIVTNAGSGAGAMTASGFHKVHGTFSIDANKKQTLIIEVYGTGHKVLTIRDDT